MDAVTLAAIAGTILTLLFSYLPWFTKWYEPLDKVGKQAVMGGFLVLVAAGVFGLTCAGFADQFGWSLTCDVVGLIGFLKILFTALVANQTVYLITRK